MSWKEMVVLTDEELTQMGVAALGARRKLLKVFAMVQDEAKRQNIELKKKNKKSKPKKDNNKNRPGEKPSP